MPRHHRQPTDQPAGHPVDARDHPAHPGGGGRRRRAGADSRFGRSRVLHRTRGRRHDPGSPDRRHRTARRAQPLPRRHGRFSHSAQGHHRRHRRDLPRRRQRVGGGIRHALRRARQSGVRPAGGRARHHPRRRRHAAPAPADRPRPGPRGDPRRHGRRRGDRGSLGVRRPRASPDQLRRFVDKLARRIAAAPATAIAAAKRAVDAAGSGFESGLRVEDQLFRQTLAEPAARKLLQTVIEAGAQTREFELGTGLRQPD